LVRRKEEKRTRRVWRMTAEAPLGEWVEVEADAPQKREATPPPRADIELPLEEGPPAPGWHDSTAELMRGVIVTDETDSMPGELFQRLFLEPEVSRADKPPTRRRGPPGS